MREARSGSADEFFAYAQLKQEAKRKRSGKLGAVLGAETREQRRVGGTLRSTGDLSTTQEKKVRFTPDKTNLKLCND